MSDVTRLCCDVNFCQLIYVTTVYCTSGRVDIVKAVQTSDSRAEHQEVGRWPTGTMQRSKFVCRTYHNPAWHLEVVRQYIPPLWRHKCYSVNQACAKWACLGVHLIVTTELGPIFSANDHRAIALFNLWVLVENKYRTRHLLPSVTSQSSFSEVCNSSYLFKSFPLLLISDSWKLCSIHSSSSSADIPVFIFVGAHNTHLQFINSLIVLVIEHVSFALMTLSLVKINRHKNERHTGHCSYLFINAWVGDWYPQKLGGGR